MTAAGSQQMLARSNSDHHTCVWLTVNLNGCTISLKAAGHNAGQGYLQCNHLPVNRFGQMAVTG